MSQQSLLEFDGGVLGEAKENEILVSGKHRGCAVLLACSFGSFVNGIFLNVRGPLIGNLCEALDSTPAAISLFLLCSGAGGVVGALPTGWNSFRT